jgi:hypothetical protein
MFEAFFFLIDFNSKLYFTKVLEGSAFELNFNARLSDLVYVNQFIT